MSAQGVPHSAGKTTAHLTEGVGERQSLVHWRRFIDRSEGLCYPPSNNVWRAKSYVRVTASPISMKVGVLLFMRSHPQRCKRLTLVFLCLYGFLVGVPPTESLAKDKLSRAPRAEPELKIIDLNIAPRPYAQGDGPLQFSVTVQLPRDLNRTRILEVTSLISSPSKTSLRFLTHRQPLQIESTRNGEEERHKVVVDLVWDGRDHRKQVAGVGTYSYEVRTKLLANGERGLRTVMVAWPKRGTLEVK
jgi:hypothetical protein